MMDMTQIRHAAANARATYDAHMAQPHMLPVTVERIGATYGVSVKHKRLNAANDLLAKSNVAAEAVSAWRARRASAPYDVLEEFIGGDLPAEELPERLAHATLMAESVSDERVNGLLTQLGAQVQRAAVTDLRAVPESAWLNPFRPIVERLIGEANALADTLGINAPRQQREGIRSVLHPWEPDATELMDTARRHAWESLAEKLLELYGVLEVVVELRTTGVVTTNEQRPLAHMLWWKNLDQLDGDPTLLREFFLANRHDGGLGLWTSEELAEADHAATLAEQDACTRTAFDAQYAAAQQFRSAEPSMDSTPLNSVNNTPAVA